MLPPLAFYFMKSQNLLRNSDLSKGRKCEEFFLKILFIYLTERQPVRKGTQAGGVGEEEAGSQRSREPDAGLDPGSLGSQPELKADA